MGLGFAGRYFAARYAYRKRPWAIDRGRVSATIYRSSDGVHSFSLSVECSDASRFGWVRLGQSRGAASLEELVRHLARVLQDIRAQFPAVDMIATKDGQAFRLVGESLVQVGSEELLRKCQGCGFRTGDILCPRCGEPLA